MSLGFADRLLSFFFGQVNSPLGRNMDRLGRLTAEDIETLRMFFESDPIDVMLFCPKCGEIHIDKPDPDVCQNCGHFEWFHDNADISNICSDCAGAQNECKKFVAWLNPPHKSHRCGSCNFVWRPADVPTNGVAHAKTKGENDTMKLVGDIRRGKAAA